MLATFAVLSLFFSFTMTYIYMLNRAINCASAPPSAEIHKSNS